MNRINDKRQAYMLELHVSRQARERYQFDQALFATNGNVIFADFRAARLFAQKLNEQRGVSRHPERAVKAGQINAMGLIDEILHAVVDEYRKQIDPLVVEKALAWLERKFSAEGMDRLLLEFVQQFPPMAVYRGLMSAEDYLAAASLREDGRTTPNRELALEELLMLWLANANPAFAPTLELFDDRDLERTTVYAEIFPELVRFFDTQPKFGPDSENLIEMLQKPARLHPHSLADQLDFIRRKWGKLISFIIIRLLSSLDLIREETKPVFGVGGQPQTWVYEFRGPEYEFEPERFSQDVYWMPNLVLLAKNSYVWLDQLSRKYSRAIVRLDQIPEAEFETLARWGITGLWLIGLWERSRASQRIKQLRGNAESIASAYSLLSYDIAADLGGDEAYQALKEMAARHGIRLASDMVPNHMGIDSHWMINHPDWFIQVQDPPFPSYSFNGPNLSSDDRVGIFIEDHYYDNSDAAVVFKRVDFWTGEARYIYHGNDGTSMPWNDTAQLNYLLPEVREAVIQTILHVARGFPIIRFDAAMTLAKRHYQRLWFPEPGSGGDIPSRAEFGMTKQQFDQAFPEEFWRMVVDRVAQELPDTLLLAEAFWLMEGYFVRTLGMHRVYNSAFMNMLRDEKNQEYRLVIKNTMEFDPEILKRFVNFMNNPDERTAVDQFGKGDKYFGICTLMATMPGLPMFGHGQVEGFTEKYGMEFRYAKWHEEPDHALVERHVREIFPLLRQRYLFAEVVNFRLYDFFTQDGYVNEDVYAFSNRAGERTALVVFHNRYAEVSGWIHRSAAFSIKTGQDEQKMLVQTSLSEDLRLHDDPNAFVIFREHVSGLEFIRPSQMLIKQGMYFELRAYQYQVFLDFREVFQDAAHPYAELNGMLNGQGTPDIAEALREYSLRDVLTPYREIVNAGMFRWLIDNRAGSDRFEQPNLDAAIAEFDQKLTALLAAIQPRIGNDAALDPVRNEIHNDLVFVLTAETLEVGAPKKKRASKTQDRALPFSSAKLELDLSGASPEVWGTLLCAIITGKLGKLGGEAGFASRSRAWLDDWLLEKVIARALSDMGMQPDTARRQTDLARVILSNQGWSDSKDGAPALASNLLNSWLADEAARRFLHTHPYDGILWFNREAFEELAWWTVIFELIQCRTNPRLAPARLSRAITGIREVWDELNSAKKRSGYQLEKLV
ncbi:MAG: alpha-amylase family glycosyl hydrolase [Anaerolineales bacterium]|nr:alpha-amylase family glycosyl hydrolase [Anaerolineales bacterium]